MRTAEAIVARINEIQGNDVFGFERADLIAYLPFAQAKPFLKPEVKFAEWNPEGWTPEQNMPSAKIMGYLPFAWEKANDCRGVSSSRSISHMRAWLWLDGKTQVSDTIEEYYEYYGKPCLVLVSEIYCVSWNAYDNGRWVNHEEEDPLSDIRRNGLIDRIKIIALKAKVA